jgi:POT family proton-dependent oligopeptide transporter
VSTLAEPASTELFGHPRGLSFLFATEMWERFSYYGMKALLVLYMVKYLLHPEHAQTVIGFAALKSGLEFLFGPLDIQPLSSHIYGLYTGLVYLTPVLGGYLADRVLGQRRMVVIGASLMAFGHFMMAFEPLFLLALFVLILGNGAFKPNISTQVGTLYAPGDPRRDRAFSIFYVGINLGAFLAPLICGTLGEELGWHYGFGGAGVGMTIGLAIYLYASRTLPPDVRSRVLAQGRPQPFGRDEWRAIGALMLLALPVMFFWATYEQQGNTIALWADAYTDRTINLLFWPGRSPSPGSRPSTRS